MAKPFIPDPDDVSASYPANVFIPWPVLDKSAGYAQITETFTWPGAANDYTIRLDYGILQQVAATIMDTTTSTQLLPVRWTDSPGPNEVAVNFDRGLLRVHPTRATNGGSAQYRPIGTVIDAQFLMQLQREVAAAQTGVDNGVELPINISDVDDLQGELNGLDSDISDLADAVAGKQNGHAQLTALAALATNGLVARTAANTVAARTITGTANEITVANGNGVSGNPTLSAAANLARLNTAQTWTARQSFGRIAHTGLSPAHREIGSNASVTINDYSLGLNAESNLTLTLPLASAVEVGTTFEIYNLQTHGSYITTINTATGTDYLVFDTSVVNSFVFNRSITGTLLIRKYFTGAWAVIRCY